MTKTMQSDWKKVKLGEVIELIIDHRGLTPKKLGGDWSNNGYRAISAKSIKGGQLVNEEQMNILPENLYKKWMKEEIRKGDILLTSEAPLGEHIIWKTEEKVVLSQRIFGIRTKHDILNPYYFNYYIDSSDFQYELKSRESGSTVTGIKQSELLKTHISLPPLPVQQKIAQILTSLDDKIELLRDENKTLEAIAQTLFKRWFVDFEFPDENGNPYKSSGGKMIGSELGMIPEGWRVGRLNEVSSKIFSGGTPDTRNNLFWGGNYMWLSSGETRSRYILETEKTITEAGVKGSSTRQANFGDILIATAGQGHTRGQTSLCLCDMYINQSIIAIRNENVAVNSSYYFHNIASRYDELRGLSEGNSIRGSITTKMIGGINVLLPTEKILLNFSDSVYSTQLKIIQNYQELNGLMKMRDLLLPKLMKGEVEL